MRIQSLVVVTSLIASAVAHAQPADPPLGEPEPMPEPAPMPEAAPMPEPAPMPVAPAPVPPPAVVAEPVSTVDKGVIEDANSGRAWWAPTALTPPAGTWSFSDHELLMVSGAYAVTDQLSISLTTLLPVVEDMPLFGILNGKMQIVKSGSIRGAIQASVTHMRDSSDGVDASFTVANVGGALTLCIDADCHSHVSGFIGAGFADSDQTAVPFLVAGSFVYRVGRLVKIVLEADSAFIAGEINETANGFLGWYGVRFTSKNIGVDLGFVRPFGDDLESPLVMGVPWVSFTYRAFKE